MPTLTVNYTDGRPPVKLGVLPAGSSNVNIPETGTTFTIGRTVTAHGQKDTQRVASFDAAADVVVATDTELVVHNARNMPAGGSMGAIIGDYRIDLTGASSVTVA